MLYCDFLGGLYKMLSISLAISSLHESQAAELELMASYSP